QSPRRLVSNGPAAPGDPPPSAPRAPSGLLNVRKVRLRRPPVRATTRRTMPHPARDEPFDTSLLGARGDGLVFVLVVADLDVGLVAAGGAPLGERLATGEAAVAEEAVARGLVLEAEPLLLLAVLLVALDHDADAAALLE